MRLREKPEPLDLGGLASALMPMAQLVSRAIDAVPFQPDQLIVSLENSLRIREAQLRGWQTFPANLLARLRPARRPTIVVDGKRLAHALMLVGIRPDRPLEPRRQYELDLVEFRRLLAALGAAVGER